MAVRPCSSPPAPSPAQKPRSFHRKDNLTESSGCCQACLCQLPHFGTTLLKFKLPCLGDRQDRYLAVQSSWLHPLLSAWREAAASEKPAEDESCLPHPSPRSSLRREERCLQRGQPPWHPELPSSPLPSRTATTTVPTQ